MKERDMMYGGYYNNTPGNMAYLDYSYQMPPGAIMNNNMLPQFNQNNPLLELNNRISILENKVKLLEQKLEYNNSNNNLYQDDNSLYMI